MQINNKSESSFFSDILIIFCFLTALLGLTGCNGPILKLQESDNLKNIIQTKPYKNDPMAGQFEVGVLEQVSIATWIRHSDYPTKNWETIVSKGDSSFRLHLNGGCSKTQATDRRNIRYGITFGIRRGCDDADLNANIVPVPGHWYHVAAVYNGKEMSIYIDGIKVNHVSVSGPIGANNYKVLIGANDQKEGRDWAGDIVGTQIWTSAITPAMIDHHRKTTKPTVTK